MKRQLSEWFSMSGRKNDWAEVVRRSISSSNTIFFLKNTDRDWANAVSCRCKSFGVLTKAISVLWKWKSSHRWNNLAQLVFPEPGAPTKIMFCGSRLTNIRFSFSIFESDNNSSLKHLGLMRSPKDEYWSWFCASLVLIHSVIFNRCSFVVVNYCDNGTQIVSSGFVMVGTWLRWVVSFVMSILCFLQSAIICK